MSNISISSENSSSITDYEDPSIQQKDLSLEEEQDLSLDEDDSSEEEKDDDTFYNEVETSFEEDDSSEEEEDEDMQEEGSETMINKIDEILKGEKRNLPHNCAKHADMLRHLRNFKYWPILNLLQPKFTKQIHMAMVYDDGNRALIVTKDKNVYNFEYNKDDQMNTHIDLYPKEIKELCGKNIKTFACSSYYILALTEEGKVYSWRFKELHIIYHTSPLFGEMTPTQLFFDSSDKYIVDIACGSYHCLALTSDGEVYVWGKNNFGQIGEKPHKVHYSFNNERYFTMPRKVIRGSFNKKVTTIACGSAFNMVIIEQGKVYSWGKSLNCIEECHPFPYQLFINEVIVKVACGFEHTLALTDGGRVYAWGNNFKGQVGIRKNMDVILDPTRVVMPELVQDIAAYGYLSVAVGSDNSIYVWGDCFGKNFATPYLTDFSTIYDAFAHSTTRVMHKPLVVSDNEDLNITESLGSGDLETFNDPVTSDFVVEVEGKRIYVHKRILGIRSQHFREKFQFDQTENNKRVQGTAEIYRVTECSYIVYKTFLKYLYTGRVDIPSNVAPLDLLKLAYNYCESEFKKECGRIITQIITVFNVAFFYGKAVKYKVKVLEEFCFQFALRHMKDVVLSNCYRNLKTDIKDTFIQRAAEANIFQT